MEDRSYSLFWDRESQQTSNRNIISGISQRPREPIVRSRSFARKSWTSRKSRKYGVCFSIFGGFLTDFADFDDFWGLFFPFFAFFPTSTPVFPSNESRGRTIAHRKRVLKPANWAPELTGFYGFVQLVDLELNHSFPSVQLTSEAVMSTPVTR